jgi:hypothetical protein
MNRANLLRSKSKQAKNRQTTILYTKNQHNHRPYKTMPIPSSSSSSKPLSRKSRRVGVRETNYQLKNSNAIIPPPIISTLPQSTYSTCSTRSTHLNKSISVPNVPDINKHSQSQSQSYHNNNNNNNSIQTMRQTRQVNSIISHDQYHPQSHTKSHTQSYDQYHPHLPFMEFNEKPTIRTQFEIATSIVPNLNLSTYGYSVNAGVNIRKKSLYDAIKNEGFSSVKQRLEHLIGKYSSQPNIKRILSMDYEWVELYGYQNESRKKTEYDREKSKDRLYRRMKEKSKKKIK